MGWSSRQRHGNQMRVVTHESAFGRSGATRHFRELHAHLTPQKRHELLAVTNVMRRAMKRLRRLRETTGVSLTVTDEEILADLDREQQLGQGSQGLPPASPFQL